MASKTRDVLYMEAIENNLVDIIDIELINGYCKIQKLKQITSSNGVYLIVPFMISIRPFRKSYLRPSPKKSPLVAISLR